MKKLLLLALVFALYSIGLKAGNLTAYFSYCTFDIPGQSPYLETYLNVVASTVKFVPVENNKLKGQLEVQWIIRSDDKIVHVDKYNLISPEVSPGDSSIPDFMDQQRLKLDVGNYEIELSIRDKNNNIKETTLKQKVTINFPNDTISISDIELVESYSKTQEPNKFTKSGYDIIPFVHTFLPKNISSLKFYAEIYRSDITPASDYLIRYFISDKEKRRVVDDYIVSLKQSPKNINIILGDFDIKNLPSGNYHLNIEIRNRENKLIAYNQLFFQRSNERNKPMVTADISAIDINNTFVTSYTNADTLVDYIACLYPISTMLEAEIADNQMKSKDIRSMQQYIYHFWRNRNNEDPEKAWLDYKLEVARVNNAYSTMISKGYDTDRGRVYLQYGPPHTMTEVKDEPSSYPYEIWHYHTIKNQSNRKFVFYTNERSSNDYRLLHSDALGEINEPKWELVLHSRSQQFGIDLGQENSLDTYGSKTKDIFSNPR